MSNRHRIFTTNDPHAMKINKELAEEIGFQESIVFLQIEFLQSISKHVFDGERWTRASLEELHSDHFPWWSTATISRILNRLQSQSLIKTAQYNKASYDRTQWFAIDPEGAGELRSVAILHSETAEVRQIADCNIEIDRLQDPSDQNETTIPETYDRDLEERSSNEDPKKAELSSPQPEKDKGRAGKVRKLATDEAQEKFDALCESDPCGGELRQLSEMLAGENKTGEVAITRVWNELGSRYIANRDRYQLTDEAWRYGFEQAIARPAPNIGYVTKAARGYDPGRDRVQQAGKGRRVAPSNSIAVIGATEEDYAIDKYRSGGTRAGGTRAGGAS